MFEAPGCTVLLTARALSRKSQLSWRLSLENGCLMLPLKADDNEIVVALVDNFYGRG
jgi:hypothetical protein